MSTTPTESSEDVRERDERQHRRKSGWRRSRRPRGWFEAVFLVAGFILTMVTPRPFPEQVWTEVLTSVLGWGLLLGGGGMRLWAALYIGGHKDKTLLVEGPYSLCRNPLYLGSVMMGAAFALLLDSGVMLAAVVALIFFYAVYLVPHEERRLLNQFGDPYKQYRRRTPMFWPRYRAFRTAPIIPVHLRSFLREIWRVGIWVLIALAVERFVDELRGPELFQMIQAII